MYSTRQVAALLDLPPGQVREYARMGVLAPERSAGGAYRFAFRDLVVLRAATSLAAASVPHARIRRALGRIKNQLDGRELTEIRLSKNGEALIASDGESYWEPESGQMQLAFHEPERPEPVACIEREITVEPQAPDPIPAEEIEEADVWFDVGRELEEPMPLEAEHAYERALISNPFHVEALVNLGRLLHIRGEVEGAVERYRAALTIDGTSSIAAFNLGVALTELGEPQGAIEAFEAAATVQPSMADAHFNLGRLYELVGDHKAALRHWSAYRRLMGS